MKKKILLTVLLLLLFAGCMQTTDPQTGQEILQPDPNQMQAWIEVAQNAGEAATGAGILLGVPQLALIGGLLTGLGLAAGRGLKKK